MNNNDRINLIHRINEIEGLTDRERSALLGLLRESKSYGLVWEDKPEAVEERMQEELPVLREVPERAIISDAPDAPNHILIEGDNLEALTTLAYTHAGRIDVIYIDPPYNTGNKDFVYNDSYVDKEDSYRHSKWLSFMSRRLKIAKQLLSDKGVIFISIDDNEQAQLKLLCDEIFSNSNFVADLIWSNKEGGGSSDSKNFRIRHEHIIVYAKNILNISIKGVEISNEDRYKEEDEYKNIRGKYYLQKLGMGSIQYSQSLDYAITAPDDSKIYPKDNNNGKKACWRWSQEKYKWGKENGFIVIKKSKNIWTVYTKQYMNCDNNGILINRTQRPFGIIDKYSSTQAAKFLESINLAHLFNYSKPVDLIQYIINRQDFNNSIVLDFFAGSGTTLHATMQLNAEDGGHRQCILVTNNENGICENVTYERNKRVIQGYTTPKGEKEEGLRRNNLRYYKTHIVPREPNNRNKRALVAAATDLLCIKNNVYKEQTAFGERKLKPTAARYFDDGKTQMLIIYNELTVDAFVKVIDEMEVAGRIKVYVFSNNRYAYNDNFEPVAEKVEVCALPAAIYDAYKKVIKPRKHNNNASADVPFAEETSIETKQGTLNFKEEGGEA